MKEGNSFGKTRKHPALMTFRTLIRLFYEGSQGINWVFPINIEGFCNKQLPKPQLELDSRPRA